jgi:hypothetical protein
VVSRCGCCTKSLVKRVSTQDVLARYISALGGTLKLIADFGDEQLKVA